MSTMSNLPMGAENDINAPYNIEEKVYKFSVEITGDFYYEYEKFLDKDEGEIATLIKERIISLLETQGDIDWKYIGVDVV